MTSYQVLLNKLETFFNAHLQVKKFGGEFREQMPNFSTMDERYPLVYVVPTSEISGMNTNVFTLEVYCVDIIQKDRANINTILSDCQLILNDLYLYYTEGTDLSITVITDPSMTPLNNFDLDYVAGWVGTFTFEVDQYSVCAIPLEPITPVTNECAPSQYLVEYENGTDIQEGTIPSGGSLIIQVPNPSECEPAIAEIYFEDELIDILTIASGDTDTINIDCSTLMNAVKVTSTWQQHKHGGTFKHIGEVNGKPAYESTTDTTKTIKYSGVNWQIIKTAPQSHVHNAANGNEAYPWLATWLDNYLTVSQATVGVYCTNGGMAYYNLVDSEGNILSQGSISEGDEDDILAPDTDLEINGSAVDSFNAASTINVTLENGSGIVTPDNITVVGNTVEVVLPDCPSVPVGATLMKTGQTTSYRTGDDGDFEAGRATSFTVLASNNPFGNTNRFTDELGGQTYTKNIVIDWSTYNGSNVLGYKRTLRTPGINWDNAIDESISLSFGGFTTGWRMANVKEIQNIYNYGVNYTTPLNYSPFNLSTNTLLLWTSTTPNGQTTGAFYFTNNGGMTFGVKTFATNITYISCRTFTVNGTTLT